MQLRALPIALAVVLTLGFTGAASAQSTKSRRPVLPPRPVPDAAVALPAKPAPVAPAPLATSTLGLGSTPGRLTGLPPVGDQGPTCRAQCSKERYVCHAGGDATDCDGRWVPCLQACSAR